MLAVWFFNEEQQIELLTYNLKEMKANELRIGNIVDMGSEGIGMVSGYNLYQKNAHDNGGAVADYYHEWKPIPLTEDWLLKFKATQFGDEGEYFDLYPTAWIKENDYFIPKPYYFADAFGDNFKLKYVHQLQNLYYALTGEELQYTQAGGV